MAALPSISTILSVAKISEYLAANDVPVNNIVRGCALDNRVANMIYMERMSVQNRFNLNPSDPTLTSTANYLWAILGKYSIAGLNIFNSRSALPPVITGPINQTVGVGSNATFSVTVISSLPVIYQWFRNGVAITGATSSSYTLPNAQLSDSGALFSVSVTNAVGVTNSNQAILTVTSSILGYLYYSPNDPGPTLQGSSDPFVYQQNYTITHNQPISIPLPGASTPNMYLVARVPSTESSKTNWFNTSLNSGSIPDANFQTPLTFSGFTYYYTRVAVSMDTTQPLLLSQYK